MLLRKVFYIAKELIKTFKYRATNVVIPSLGIRGGKKAVNSVFLPGIHSFL